MNGEQLFLDTNIILYFLNGEQTLTPVFEDKELLFSVITQLELLSYSEITETEINGIKAFLNECRIVEINSQIKENTIFLRKKYSLKLPDAIISGSAMYMDAPLVTADKKLSKIKEIDVIWYQHYSD